MAIPEMMVLGFYALAFIAFTLIVGGLLRSRGKVFLGDTFQDRPAVADSVDFLLSLGFYLLCFGLLLWNLGVAPGNVYESHEVVREIALRLGISIFVVAAFHSMNILILSVLNRTNQASN